MSESNASGEVVEGFFDESNVDYPNLKKTKAFIGLVVQIGAGRIIKQIIEKNVEPEKRLDKITIPAASYALAGVVKKKAREYTDDAVDKWARSWAKSKKNSETMDIDAELQKTAQKFVTTLDNTVQTLTDKKEKRESN